MVPTYAGPPYMYDSSTRVDILTKQRRSRKKMKMKSQLACKLFFFAFFFSISINFLKAALNGL